MYVTNNLVSIGLIGLKRISCFKLSDLSLFFFENEFCGIVYVLG